MTISGKKKEKEKERLTHDEKEIKALTLASYKNKTPNSSNLTSKNKAKAPKSTQQLF